MKINDFMNVLKEKIAATDLNFGDDADSVLSFLCGAYYDQKCNSDSEEIKQAFEDLYEAMNGKTLREKDEVIYAVCRLCRGHQQTGFVDGITRPMPVTRTEYCLKQSNRAALNKGCPVF